MCLPDSRGPLDQQRRVLPDERAGRQGLDLTPLDRRLKREVELAQGHPRRQPGEPQRGPDPPLITLAQLQRQQPVQDLVRRAVVLGRLGQLRCSASVGMGKTNRSNKLQSRAEVFPCPRRLGNAPVPRRRPPSFGFISSNASRFRTSVTSTTSIPQCSTAGRRSSSRTPPPPSNPELDAPIINHAQRTWY